MCKHNPKFSDQVTFPIDTVDSLWNTMKTVPIFLDSSVPKIGLSESSVFVEDRYVKCTFKRDKFHDEITNYYNLITPRYILAALGLLDAANGK